ncbi:MAG TPA: sugar ABC transporter substrate-binding protein [Candidatus Methylomirabilis sp.]|nr:sugar ABC transporter substrate-binding protein [Candidatus Methylomirabilis sp.]
MIRSSRWWVVAALIVGIAVLLAAGPAAAQVKIRFQTWHWNEKPVFFALEEFMNEFNKSNPGIEVVRDDSRYADKETVYIAQSQAKAAADIAHFQHRAIPLFADRGFIMDLTPFIEREGGQKFLAQWDQNALETCKYKGKIYCLNDYVNPLALLYNTQHFKEAGLDPNKPPTTPAELVDSAKKLTRGGRYGIGLIGSRQEGLFMRFNPFFWGTGAEYLTPDNKRSALDTAEALEGFRFYVELFTKHKVVPPGVVEQGAQEVRTQIAHEKVSMEIGVIQAPLIYKAINPNMKVDEVMAAAPIPSGKKRVSTVEYGMRVISAFTKHPEEAWKVYKAWVSRDVQLRNFKIYGVMSARLDVKSSPEIANHKFAKIFAAQAPYGKIEPLIPEWPKIGDATITAVQEGFSGVKTPEQALKDLHNATNRALGVQ